MIPEEAAMLGFITADEYLDTFGEPRRPWPEEKDRAGQYCVMCQHFFYRAPDYRRHMRQFHLQVVST